MYFWKVPKAPSQPKAALQSDPRPRGCWACLLGGDLRLEAACLRVGDEALKIVDWLEFNPRIPTQAGRRCRSHREKAGGLRVALASAIFALLF